MLSLIGYLGSGILCLSYLLFVLKKIGTTKYLILNIIGCIISTIYAFILLNFPMVVVNLFFLTVGILGLKKGLKDE
jgi:hypothetical protein